MHDRKAEAGALPTGLVVNDGSKLRSMVAASTRCPASVMLMRVVPHSQLTPLLHGMRGIRAQAHR
jgi:hypothetical protein